MSLIIRQSRNLGLVVGVLSSVKPTDVGDLASYDLETICKYVYEGMKYPSEYNTAHLLSWHEKLTECGGLGLLVRVITDQNTA